MLVWEEGVEVSDEYNPEKTQGGMVMVIVRGGGDIATGSIYRLFKCGYRVLVLEGERPSAIRRRAAFCEAVYDGEAVVEGVRGRRVETEEECRRVWAEGGIPVMADPLGRMIGSMRPEAVVDGILAKGNMGTRRDMARVTVALGPGFCAGRDVDYVIETMRGHRLGCIIEDGCALPNTGVPGVIGGYGAERVIHAPAEGRVCLCSEIGDIVEKGQTLAMIGDVRVEASLTGVLRGIIRDGFYVTEGLKLADIDPRREQRENCTTISDKARCIAGSVLEVLVRCNVEREFA